MKRSASMIRNICFADQKWRARVIVLLFLGTYATLSAQERDNFTFIAIGDAGYPGPILDQNGAAINGITASLDKEKNPLDALVFLGDNFYPIGLNIRPKERTSLISEVLSPHAYTLLTLGPKNVHAVPGNHDYYCATLGPIPYGRCNEGNVVEQAIPIWTYYLREPSSVRYPTYSGSPDSVELIFVDSPMFLLNSESDWHLQLDTLENLLHASKVNQGVKWRMMFFHHSPFSAGEHGGFTLWSESKQRIVYRGCSVGERDNPVKLVQRLAGYHEENCDPHYQNYKDSLFKRIVRSGATIHATFGGHDHSLQLLSQVKRPPGTPGVFVISGAGSKQTGVGSPQVDTSVGMSIYTHPIIDNHRKGTSIFGFAVGTIEKDKLKLWFIDGATGEPADMGGASQFFIDSTGTLVDTR